MSLVEKFITNPKNLEMGAGKLAERWNCSKQEIYTAKAEARKMMSDDTLETIPDNTTFVGSETSDGEVKKTYHTPKPLTVKEIHDLVAADGLTSKITKISDKLLANGTWVYTIEIKTDDFYSRVELDEKLKNIFPKLKPVSLPSPKKTEEKMLSLVISDDHVGSVHDYTLFGNSWDADIYKKRLLTLVDEAKNLGTFEEVNVISLGDQMNGWNSQTTRGGHEVKSLSNKDQFDMYTNARVAFYDALLSSGIAKKYTIRDVENSNHTGNDFSYMANKFLQLYLSQKFPGVDQISYFLPLESFDYGIHTIGMTHGKDEIVMTRAMPLKLDAKTDLFLYQYFDTKKISPSSRQITLYKGDLHSYNVERGKFGRYVNIPSVMGSSTWTEVNFGNTVPGALLEIFNKTKPLITHIPILF